MRKMNFKFAAIALAALTFGFASCSKEDTDGNTVPEGQKAYLTISVVGNAAAKSRAIDNDQAATINDFTVFIIGPANEILGKKYVDAAGGKYDEYGTNLAKDNVQIPTTTTARHIYVVGNTGSDLTAGSALFGDAVTNLAQLQTAYLKLESISTAALWIEGHTTAPLDFVAGGAANGIDYLATPDAIQMKLIPSRVDVYVNNNMINYGVSGSMELNSISFLNSAGWTSPIPYSGNNYAPADNILSPYYRSGIIDYGSIAGLTPGTITQLGTLTEAWVPSVAGYVPTPPDASSAPANWKSSMQETFYALPGDSRTEIVTVEATLADGTTKVYFPVHFGTVDTQNNSFESGKRYVMTINLNGDAKTGGGGVTDPEIPAINAFVTVKVTAAQWDLKNLPAKNFQ